MSKDKREEKQAILGELESIKDLLNEDEFADIPTLDDSLAPEDIPVLTQHVEPASSTAQHEQLVPTLEPLSLDEEPQPLHVEPQTLHEEPHIDAETYVAIDDADIPLLTPELDNISQLNNADHTTAMEWETTHQTAITGQTEPASHTESQAVGKAEEIYSELLNNIEASTELPVNAELDLSALESETSEDKQDNQQEPQTHEDNSDEFLLIQETEPQSEPQIETVEESVENEPAALTEEQAEILDQQISAAEDQLQQEQQVWREAQVGSEAEDTETDNITEVVSELDTEIPEAIEETDYYAALQEELEADTIADIEAVGDLPPLSQAPHALPGQQSLFEHGEKEPAQKTTPEEESVTPAVAPEEAKPSKKDPKPEAKAQKPSMPKARGENPFLPKHIRDRLHTNKPLVEVIKEHPPVPEIHAHPTNHVVEAVLAEFMPKIEAELRDRLLKLADEGRLDEEKPL